MGTEIKVWQLSNGILKELSEDSLSDKHYEKDLEDWIEKDTSLLGSKLLVIGRQHDIPGVGCLDLLCIDETGTLVVVEFKRDSTNRETVAQILDYASWLDGASEEEIQTCAQGYLKKALEDAFQESFGSELQSLIPQNHRMLVVAPRLDSSAERLINYLAERHNVKINAIFFRYAKTTNSDEVLIRTVLVPEKTTGDRAYSMNINDLSTMADRLRTTKLVEICRKLAADIEEERPKRTYGGSFRYWYKHRMIFGINVAGERRSPPIGQLDVWIPVPSLSQTTSVVEQDIRERLTNEFTTLPGGANDIIVRLKSEDDADKLVKFIRQWLGVTARSPLQA